MTLLPAALAYAQKFSIHVFPLAPKSKIPFSKLAPRGFLSATTDPGIITNWWTVCPEANIGIACASSGFVVIDRDPRNGGDDTMGALQRELGPLPATWTSLTAGGGDHMFFKDCVGDYLGTLGEGVDIKFNGYVVAPPSIGPNGRPYSWDAGAHPADTPLAALPDAWLDRMTKRKTVSALPSTGDDARNSYLGAAFEALGWLGNPLADGKRMVRCPWFQEHTDKRGDGQDSSTIIFPRALGRSLGGFHCAHGHCSRRTWKDVIATLPEHARDAGKRAAARYAPRSIWDEAV